MRVEWEGEALDKLAELYVDLNLDQQRLLGRSVEGINSRLLLEPWNLGESRGKNRRVWFSQYLIVQFQFMPNGTIQVRQIKPNPANWFQ